jgi:putative tryptophan/tyrosine transport system substrate-binding protein
VTNTSRRDFVQGAGAVGLGLLAGCGRLPGQSTRASVGHIGYLTSADVPSRSRAFQEGLRAHGYVEGQTIVTEYRFADNLEHLRSLAVELVRRPVDVIVVGDTPAAVAAQHATTTIPIVIAVGDPVGTGLVASLARPGGNVTGLSNMTPQLAGKRLELLRETVPALTRVAVLWNPGNATKAIQWSETQAAAQTLGIPLQSLEVHSPEELESVFAVASRERVEAIIVFGEAITTPHAATIVALAAKSGLAAMYENREFMTAGGLMSYGPDFPAMHRRAVYYVDRILKGASPADLPIEQPMTFDLIVNLQTAQALGLTIPQHVLLQATEVIQ